MGGGRVAERKVLSLLKACADVTVISPSLTAKLQKERDLGHFRHLSRRYKKNDLRSAFLVIASTDSPATNSRIAKSAPALLNVVDVPSECNFIAPAVVRKGPLLIAVSTSGASPALSATIRKELEKLFGDEFAGYLTFIQKIRSQALAGIGDKEERERFLKGLASVEMIHSLRVKGLPAVRKIVTGRLNKLLHQP